MSFWNDFWAQALGGLASGAVLLPLALWLEAVLDERRERRHERREARRREHERGK